MRRSLLISLMLTILFYVGQAYAEDLIMPNKTREQLIEVVLLKRYISNFSNITGNKLYQCPRISEVRGVGDKYEIKATLVTFEGPHNPPYDAYIITFYDEPRIVNGQIAFKFDLKNVKKIRNLTGEQLGAFCK